MSVIPSTPELRFIRLRPETREDELFLYQLYASTREAELARVGWDTASLSAFIKMQFHAMRQGYAVQHPHATFSVILLNERPIGRFLVDRTGEAIELVDVALVPEQRGRGIGTGLIRKLFAEASGSRKPIRLQALKEGRPVHWYTRLEFVPVLDDGLYVTLEWRPSNDSSQISGGMGSTLP